MLSYIDRKRLIRDAMQLQDTQIHKWFREWQLSESLPSVVLEACGCRRSDRKQFWEMGRALTCASAPVDPRRVGDRQTDRQTDRLWNFRERQLREPWKRKSTPGREPQREGWKGPDRKERQRKGRERKERNETRKERERRLERERERQRQRKTV